jgi:hypothetical protein
VRNGLALRHDELQIVFPRIVQKVGANWGKNTRADIKDSLNVQCSTCIQSIKFGEEHSISPILIEC